jgi:hypothetical protein
MRWSAQFPCIVRGLFKLTPASLLAFGSVATSCAPALSSFTPAHVAPKQHVQAELGFDASVPTGSIKDIVDEGATIAKAARERELTEEEEERLFLAGTALGLNPPSLVAHVGAGYTLLDHFEIGGRLSSGAWRLGARYQLLEQALQSVDGTVSLGGGRYSYEFPLSDQIPFITLEDFSRWQVDMAFLVGRHGDWYRVWGGPRLLFSFYGTQLVFQQPSIPGETTEKIALASVDGTGTYLGGQLGAALGYKHVFIGFELTCAKFWSSASLKLLDRRRDVELESFIVYPGLALLVEL